MRYFDYLIMIMSIFQVLLSFLQFDFSKLPKY